MTPLPQASRRRVLFLSGSALLLTGAVLFRQPLESSMATHMLLQMPAIFLAGVLMAASLRRRAPVDGIGHRIAGALQRLRCYDEHGVPGLLLISFLLTYWMIPKLIDQALVSALVETGKFTSLFAGGLLLADCLPRANRVIQLFFLGNIAWMMAIVGLLYQDSSARLCNFYLLDDQVMAGQGLVALAVLLPGLWVWRQMRRDTGRRATAVAAGEGETAAEPKAG